MRVDSGVMELLSSVSVGKKAIDSVHTNSAFNRPVIDLLF